MHKSMQVNWLTLQKAQCSTSRVSAQVAQLKRKIIQP